MVQDTEGEYVRYRAVMARLAIEVDEVNARLEKLQKFIGTMEFDALARPHRYLLRQQVAVMRDYSEIVMVRMALFEMHNSEVI